VDLSVFASHRWTDGSNEERVVLCELKAWEAERQGRNAIGQKWRELARVIATADRAIKTARAGSARPEPTMIGQPNAAGDRSR
jgi:hypothetical protein